MLGAGELLVVEVWPQPPVTPRPQQVITIQTEASASRLAPTRRAHAVMARNPAYATGSAAPATPRLVEPTLISLLDETAPRRHMSTQVVHARSSGYAQANLPPQPRLIKPLILDVQRPRRSARIVTVWRAGSVPGLPTRPFVLSAQPARRRFQPRVVMPRWLVYAWANLPPQPPNLPSRVVALVPRRRKSQISAAWPVGLASTVTPVTPPIPKQVVISARRRRWFARIVAPWPSGLAVTTAPIVPPIPRQVMVSLVDETTPRRHMQPRILLLRVVASITAPAVSPRRPVTIQSAARRRRAVGQVTLPGVQRFAPTATVFTPTLRAMSAYPAAGSQADAVTGDSAFPAAGSSGASSTGSGAQPGAGSSGQITI